MLLSWVDLARQRTLRAATTGTLLPTGLCLWKELLQNPRHLRISSKTWEGQWWLPHFVHVQMTVVILFMLWNWLHLALRECVDRSYNSTLYSSYSSSTLSSTFILDSNSLLNNSNVRERNCFLKYHADSDFTLDLRFTLCLNSNVYSSSDFWEYVCF